VARLAPGCESPADGEIQSLAQWLELDLSLPRQVPPTGVKRRTSIALSTPPRGRSRLAVAAQSQSRPRQMRPVHPYIEHSEWQTVHRDALSCWC
jgi:hypothetical protein